MGERNSESEDADEGRREYVVRESMAAGESEETMDSTVDAEREY